LVIRRLHALADVDSGFSQADRGEWRRNALTTLIGQHAGEFASGALRRRSELVDTFHMLTSSKTDDDLTRGRRSKRQSFD
jgi:hypothetical protein